MYKEVFIKGYYRVSGIFVSPHIRNRRTVRSYNSVDKNQLVFDFSGKTIWKQ